MVIAQGAIFWVDVGAPVGSGPGYTRPCVVIQNNFYNGSALNTVIVCELTTNLRRASDPGNVLLNSGEANLPKQSVVNVSQVFTVDKKELRDQIGTLSPRRVQTILAGIFSLLNPRDAVEKPEDG